MNSKVNFKATHFIITSAILITYLVGASYQGIVVNKDMNRTDQYSYMAYAKNMRMTDYQYIGGRNRMPVFPFLMSLVYSPNMSDDEFFLAGKVVNILLSVVYLTLIYLIVQRYFPKFESKIYVLIAAFTVFMFKAGFFQCEVLFYFLNFCLFLCLFFFLIKPGYLIGGFSGILAAGAHLTKASIMPAIFCFSIFYIIYYFLSPLYDTVFKHDGCFNDFLKRCLRHLLILTVFFTTFIVTIFPYISTSKRIFGHYFYNVNSTFYIWYDSFDDAVKGTRGHGDRVGWPKMPAEEIPSMSKYLREHSIKQIAQRLLKGLIIVPARAYFCFGYFKYFCIYFFICMSIVMTNLSKLRGYLKKQRNYIFFLYLAAYFLGYYVLYAFYTPIASGPRFGLALFLPAMFCMFYFMHKFEFNYYCEKLKLHINAPIIHCVVGVILLSDILFHLTFRLRAYAGN